MCETTSCLISVGRELNDISSFERSGEKDEESSRIALGQSKVRDGLFKQEEYIVSELHAFRDQD